MKGGRSNGIWSLGGDRGSGGKKNRVFDASSQRTPLTIKDPTYTPSVRTTAMARELGFVIARSILERKWLYTSILVGTTSGELQLVSHRLEL